MEDNELLDFQITHAMEHRKERFKTLKRYLLASTLAAAIAAILSTAPTGTHSIKSEVGGVTIEIPITLAIDLSLINSAFIYVHFALASRLMTAVDIRLLGLLSRRYQTENLQAWLLLDSGWSKSLRFLRDDDPADTVVKFIAALPVGFAVPALYMVVAALRPQVEVLVAVAICLFLWWAARRHFSKYLSFEGLKRVETESNKHTTNAVKTSALCDESLATTPSVAVEAKVEDPPQ